MDEPRKPMDWEPPYAQVRVEDLQQIIQKVVDNTLAGAGGIPPGAISISPPITSDQLNRIEEKIMSLSALVQSMIDEVAATKSIEEASAKAMTEMVSQSKALNDQLAAAVAAAGAAGMSAEDTAALAKSAADLHASAVALQAAVPAVPPVVAPAPAAPVTGL